mmetsp:Transcript_25237/g.71169  ORF Transcript_25237/g.71169 Transcript_25237/m.71169 type:complete len:259 (+) Transcript_25237:168-944(+)
MLGVLAELLHQRDERRRGLHADVAAGLLVGAVLARASVLLAGRCGHPAPRDLRVDGAIDFLALPPAAVEHEDAPRQVRGGACDTPRVGAGRGQGAGVYGVRGGEEDDTASGVLTEEAPELLVLAHPPRDELRAVVHEELRGVRALVPAQLVGVHDDEDPRSQLRAEAVQARAAAVPEHQPADGALVPGAQPELLIPAPALQGQRRLGARALGGLRAPGIAHLIVPLKRARRRLRLRRHIAGATDIMHAAGGAAVSAAA